MKHVLSFSILFLYIISLTTSSFSKSLFKKKNLTKRLNSLKKLRHLDWTNSNSIDTSNIIESYSTDDDALKSVTTTEFFFK